MYNERDIMPEYIAIRDDGIMCATLPDSLDMDSIIAFVDQYSYTVNKGNVVARVLIDATNLNMLPSLSDQKLFISELKEKVRDTIEGDRVALVVNSNSIVLTAIRSVVALSGYSHVRIVKSFEEAETYLKS